MPGTEQSPSRRQEQDNLLSARRAWISLSIVNSCNCPLNAPLPISQNHTDVNQLLLQFRTVAFSFIEKLVASVIQQLLYDRFFLATLKVLAAKSALRFKGFRPTSIRLLSGKPIPIDSPYFAKATAQGTPRSQK